MLSPEQLEQYRRMTPGERIVVSLKMTAWNWEHLFRGPQELIDRRFELLNRENDLRNKNMLEAIARSKKNDGKR